MTIHPTKTGKRKLAKPSDATSPGRCFAYVRVSTDEQVSTGQSLAVQTEHLHAWAKMHDRVIDEVLTECGASGGTPLHERPQGGRLCQLVQRGDTVVANKLDRMFRSARDCLDVVETFKDRGVSLHLCDINGGADDVSGNGIARLFLTLLGTFAEFERDRIGERIRATKRAQKARGEYSGGVMPFGWTRDGDKLVEVPEQQAAIRKMKAMRKRGLSLRAIRDAMNAAGVAISHTGVQAALGEGPQAGDMTKLTPEQQRAYDDMRASPGILIAPDGTVVFDGEAEAMGVPPFRTRAEIEAALAALDADLDEYARKRDAADAAATEAAQPPEA